MACLALLSLRDEPQRHAVVAPALPGGLWTVVEHVPMVTTAAHTVVLRAWPDQLKVALDGERVGYRGEETRPARAAIKLHRRGKERQTAAGTDEYTRPLLVVQWA